MKGNDHRPHVLLITTSYPSAADRHEFAGSFAADFAEALAKHVDVTVVAPGRTADVRRHDVLQVHYFRVARLPLSSLRAWAPGDWPEIARALSAGARLCRSVAAARPIDHALALWALPSGYWARQLPGHVRYSVWGLGSDIWTLGRIPVVRSVLTRVLREADHCFADGLQLAADMERIGGRTCRFLPTARVFPASHSRTGAATPPYRLAFLGRWHPNKGIDLLLDALTQLSEVDWQRISEVRIAGGGPLEERVHATVAGLALAGRPITLLGFLDRNAAAELFDWTDFVVLPSRIESIPVVFSDAMQARRPLISTPVGDLSRLLKEYGTGVLCDSATAHGIAQGLRQALGGDTLALHAGLARAASDFDIQASATAFAKTLFPAPTPAATPEQGMA